MSATPQDTGSPTSTSSPTPTSTPTDAETAPQAVRPDDAAGDQVSLQASCDLDGETPVGTVAVAYPEGWLVDQNECGFFDPTMESLDSPEPTGVDVHWTVDNAAFNRAADAETIEEDSRLTATVASRQAVRIQGSYTGDGFYPDGTRVTSWIVDLDPGTDDEGGILVGTTHQSEAIEYPHAVDVLDEMASSVILPDNPAGQAGIDAVLARSEGGGAPFTVVLNEGCLRLKAGDYSGEIQDEQCDNVIAGDQTMRLWTLSSDTVTVAAGLVSVEVDQILVARDGQDVQRGTIPVSVEGAWAMAIPIQEGDVLHAVDAEGNTLATAAPLG